MTPLIGREDELARVTALVAAASAGAGGFALIEGPAGIGKSALLEAAAAAAVERHRGRVLRGRAWEEGGAPPYWPWQEIATAGGWPITWADQADPFQLYAEVLAAARAAAADAGLLVLVVDDLHAADDDTLRLTRYLARGVAEAPIALLAAARPGDRISAVARHGAVIGLTPLVPAAAARLVDALAPVPLDPAARDRVLATADGNPLYLRELARGAATGRPVPADLVSVVTPILDRQPDEVRRLVELAAVLGRSTPAGRLAAAADRPLLDVLRDLEPVLASGLLRAEGSPPRVTFSHQLLRDLLYDGLPPARRLELHARAAASATAGRDQAALSEQAHHLLAAVPVVDAAEAMAAAERAAAHARDRMAFTDAAHLLRQAAALTDEPATRFPLLLQLGQDLRRGGQVTEASAVLSDAVELARTIDGGALASAVLARTELVGWGAGTTGLVPLVTEALAVATAPPVAARLRARRAGLLATGTDLDAALGEARQALAAARALQPGDDAVMAEALAAMHRCCWRPGELDEALAHGRELVEVATRLGDDDRLAEALLATLIDELRAGDLPAVDAVLGRLDDLAARSRLPRHRYFVLSRQAMRAYMAGRLGEAERLNERAYELGQQIEEPDAFEVFHGARELVVDRLESPGEIMVLAGVASGMTWMEPRIGVHAAIQFLRAGDNERARHELVALAGSIPLTLGSLPLFDLCLLAEVAAVVGPPEIVDDLWTALEPHAGRLVVNAGAVTFGGVVDEYLGRLALARGRADDARRLLAEAERCYQRLDTRIMRERVALLLASTPAAAGSAADGSAGDGAASAPDPPSPGGSGPRRPDEAGLRAVFRRRGDGWEIGSGGGAPALLRDARGLQHLHALLRAPGREIPAAQLAGAVGAADRAAREAHHALLDDRAKADYRRRVRDLQEELDEADANADYERAARARAELDVLLDELRRAVGLRGQDRGAGSTAERARVAVRKAIAASIDRIAAHDPRLAALLESTVSTGHYCAYQPSPLTPVAWQLD